MDIKFRDRSLDRLEIDADFDAGFPVEAVRAYRRRINQIRQAVDERDLRAIRAFRFKKLHGKRAHQCSLRLNDQWRLIVEIEKGSPKNTIVVVSIEDYH